MSGRLQCGEKKVVGVHDESDVFRNLLTTRARFEFQHLELDNWWRINRPAIGGGWKLSVARLASDRWS